MDEFSDSEIVTTAPLSFVQEQLWLFEQFEPARTLEMATFGLRLHGRLSVETLERSLREIVRRHQILRTVFPVIEGQPIQKVLTENPISLTPLIDLSGLPELDRETALMCKGQEIAEQPCDLSRGPLFRCSLIRLGEYDHSLHIVAHHTIFDVNSASILISELKALYEAFLVGKGSPLPEPELQYSDFSHWERQLLETGVLDEDIQYWGEQLSGAPPLLALPGDYRRPPVKGTEGWREVFSLGDHLAPALQSFSRRHGASTFIAMLAGFGALVYRYTGRTDFVLGTLMTNRPRSEMEGMIGQFANALPFRLNVSGDPTFGELLIRCRDVFLAAFDHQHLAFEKLVEKLRPPRDPSHTTLIQHLFALKPVEHQLTLADLEATPFEVPRSRGRFDMIVEVEAAPDRLRAWVEYDTQLYGQETIAQMMRHYGRILEAWVANPHLRLSQLPMLDAAELATLVTLGKPLGYQVLILDENLQVVPPGVPGLLYVSEPAIAEGYLNQAALTAERFIPNPFAETPGGRLYRTDDLARWNRKGVLEFLGQIDEQAEVLGLDIALVEIETVLATHPQLAEAAVVAAGEPGNTSLMAYVIPQGPLPKAGELREFLSQQLPQYMVPDVFHQVPTIPRESNGKVNRQALLHLYEVESTVSGSSAASLEAFLVDVWGEVMKLDQLGLEDDFFELGGHSMLAARLLLQLRESLQIDLPLRTIFQYPTVAELAAEIRRTYPDLERALDELVEMPEETFSELLAETGGRESLSDLRSAGELLAPLAFSQQQFWVMDQITPDKTVYTIPLSFRIHGRLDVDALRQAINGIVARHESLRTTVALVDEVPMQRIAPELVLEMPLIDLTGFPAEERQAQVNYLVSVAGNHTFDLSRGPLFFAQVIRVDINEHLLLLSFHHLVTDEISMGVFMQEMTEFYKARLEQRPPQLPGLSLQYGDYAAWEREWLNGTNLERLERFWRRQLLQAPTLELPTDHPRPPQLRFEGNFLARSTPASLFQKIAALAQHHQATPFLVFVAATAGLIHHFSGQDDFVIGVPCENRNLPGAERLIGSFLNVIPLRIDRSGEPTFLEFLRRIRNTFLEAYNHQALPISKIIEAAGIPRQPNRMPLIQVSCEMQLEGWLPLDLPECTYEYEFIGTGTARYEMAFHALVKPESLWLGVELNTGLWRESTGERLLADLEAGLAEIVEDPTRPLSTYRFQSR